MAELILGEVGDVRRFPSKHHFATYTGSAPTEVSSGEITRHWLSRAGNRRLNLAARRRALAPSLRRPREDLLRPQAPEGKGRKGAMRCLKRRLSDEVYRHLAADAPARESPAEPAAGTPGS